MPVEISLDDERELRATEWLSPFFMLRNSRLIRDARIALATAKIRICRLVKIKF